MLARAVFFDKITDGDYLYNSYNGDRCNIGIIKIDDSVTSISDVSKVHSNKIILVNIPDETEAIYNMVKYKHKLFKKDVDTYEISTPYIEKSWILKEIDVDKDLYNLLIFDTDSDSVLNRYYYMKHILAYLDKHDMDLYTEDYVYELLRCIQDYIVVTDFEKKVQQRLSKVICTYLRDRMNNTSNNKIHSKDFYNYFEEDDNDDDIIRKISSSDYIFRYIKDIIIEYEISILNRSLTC